MQALPVFSALADLHLNLLVDVIKNKDTYGISPSVVDIFRDRYSRRTKVGGTAIAGSAKHRGAERHARIADLRDLVESAPTGRARKAAETTESIRTAGGANPPRTKQAERAATSTGTSTP
ncbi:insecticidal delta-endotoxin Cry8Ea1 family protein [Streptomyces sp. NPDC052040]|uniref:insecticidal delta-endotoxin Cry8Ea1 family protein n=1 Tax=unclassified Streptomyces TaxID=2593676 RepID=UPI0037CDD3D0